MNDEELKPESEGEDANDERSQSRRAFLRSLGRWSSIIIGTIALGGLVKPDDAAGWVNGGAGWINGRGGGSAGWVNRAGGGGATWVNRSGGGGAGWVNRAGGAGWVNRAGGGGSWVNRRGY